MPGGLPSAWCHLHIRLLIFLLAILIPACASSSSAFSMMYSAYKLNKQADHIQPWHIYFRLESVCCSTSSSNCCCLTCIQISQETGQVLWYCHLLKDFPLFVVTHTVKGFGLVNKAEENVFLELSYFSIDPTDVGNLILVPLPFLNPAWTSGSSQSMYHWSLAWRILSITLWACEVSAIVQ